MSRFAPALRRVARDLELPRTVRAEIVLEMAADLEAVYAHHRERGESEEVAQRLAEETVLGSSEVVRRLGQLHRGSWREWSEDVAARLTGGAGLLLLAVGVLPMFLVAGTVSARMLAGSVDPFLVALVPVGAAIAAVVTVQARRTVRGGSAAAGSLPVLLMLSVLAPAIGLLAMTLGFHFVAMEFMAGAVDAARRVELLARIGRAAAVFLIGLLLGTAGGLSWFILLDRASVRAAREVDRLLREDAAPDAGNSHVIPLVRRREA